MNHEALLDLIRGKQKFDYRGANPSFRQIAKETGVQPSTFTRIAAGKQLQADALLRILAWLNVRGEAWGSMMPLIVKSVRRKKAS